MSAEPSFAKALFLDRDGTIIKEIPSKDASDKDALGYVTELSQVELIEDSSKAVALAKKLGYKVIIISNQSAIARGWLTEEKLREINNEMSRQLQETDSHAIIDDLFYSPYHLEGIIKKYIKDSPLRKPDIGMIIEAKKKHNIDLSKSYFIGDSYTDMRCSEKAGTKSILVMTGYGKKAYKRCLDEGMNINFFAKNLYDAVKFIKRQEY
jgi:D-glycero-D-manno-heptose 1,7-bisphosphate phosphatase